MNQLLIKARQRTALPMLLLMPLLLLTACSGGGSSTPATNTDAIAPTVVYLKDDIALQKIIALFDEPLSGASIDETTFKVKRSDGSLVSGKRELASNGKLIEFFADPAQPFLADERYLVIYEGVSDVVGNRMVRREDELFFSSNTGVASGGVDNQRPVMTSRTPALGALNVALDATIRVTFSETLDCSVIQNHFTLQGANGGALSCSGNVVTYTPPQVLQSGTTYTAVLVDVSDLAGNKSGNISWSFSTIGSSSTAPTPGQADTTPPTVTSKIPTPETGDVPLNSTVQITFSEDVDCSSVVLRFDTPATAADFSCEGRSASITPMQDLIGETYYTVLLQSGVKDLAGNGLVEGAVSWGFNTMAAAAGSTPPVSTNDLTTPGVGTGTTYYVATNGNDSNAGTLAAPFLTLDKAVNQVGPGDVIEIRAGSYAGVRIDPENAGADNAWITMRPYQNEHVVIDGGRSETIYFYIGSTYDTGCNDFDPATLCQGTPMYWRIEGLEIIGGTYYAVQIENPNVVLYNNDLHSAPYDIVKINNEAHDVVIANNKIHDNAAAPASNAQGVDCVGVKNLWVVNNHVYNIPSIGIYCKGNARNTVIENNLVENVYGEGIMLGQQTDAARLTDGNFESYDGVIRNNVVVNSEESCLATSSSRDVKIYNNTCYNSAINRHGSIHVSNQSELDKTLTAGLNINIYNNLIISNGANPAVKIDYNALSSAAELHMDNNLYWNLDGSTPTLVWRDKLGDAGILFTDWQSRSGVDQNSLAVDPQLRSSANGDYALTSTSPAIDAGSPLVQADVPKDFANAPRPQGNGIDIGAFENGSAVVTIPSTGSSSTVSDITGLASEMPTAVGKSILRRYPYLQTDSATRVKVIWGTQTSANATISYRKLSDTNWLTAVATATANDRSYYYQKADLTGLQPDTQYVYSIYHGTDLLVKDMTFKTLPDSTSNGVSFVVIGDSGTRYSQPRGVRDQIARKDATGNFLYPHDFVVGVGDLAYSGQYLIDGTLYDLADGAPETFDFNFFDVMSGRANVAEVDPAQVSILSRRPFFGTLGNHEYANTVDTLPMGFTESFDFPVPAGIPSQDAEHYYSFDAGNAHFIMLDSQKVVPSDPAILRLPEMIAWLKKDLQATTKKWKVAFFHHAIFSSGKHGYYDDKRENVTMRKQFATLFQQYGVKLVLFGHEHFYQRSVPLKIDAATGHIIRNLDGSIDQNSGVTYVLSGHGGKDHHQRETDPSVYGTPAWQTQQTTSGVAHDFTAINPVTNEPVLFDDPARTRRADGQPDVPEFPADRWGFVHVVVGDTQIEVGSYNRSGEVLDQFTLQ